MILSLLQDAVSSIPEEARASAGWASAGGAAVGLALWAIGAKFSRSLITLLSVSAGAALGLYLPRWLGMSIDTWTTAAAGAVLCGIAGYILHALCVRIGVGLLAGLWGFAGAWMIYGQQDWSWPKYKSDKPIWEYAQKVWDAWPKEFRGAGPAMLLVGLLTGWTLAVFLPRTTMYLFYTLLGLALMVLMGLFAAMLSSPASLEKLPQTPSAQLTALSILAALGLLLQWLTSTRRPARPAAKPSAAANGSSEGAG